MASIEKHCKVCINVFGEDFEHVHRWLDEFAVDGDIVDVNHRRHRHHAKGVEEVRKKWGERAAKAARNHIVMDIGKVYSEAKMKKFYPWYPEYVKLEDTIIGDK